jgi:Mrp family chromosome partitioning ATPase
MNDLMADLKSRYDFIVLDMPPLELSADAYAMSRFADATLLVVRHGNTPRNLLKKLDENIELQHLKDVRIVLNGVKARGFPRRYFGYGFGYGHELVPKKQLLKLSKSA